MTRNVPTKRTIDALMRLYDVSDDLDERKRLSRWLAVRQEELENEPELRDELLAWQALRAGVTAFMTALDDAAFNQLTDDKRFERLTGGLEE